MALSKISLTAALKCSSGHSRLDGDLFELDGRGYAAVGRYSNFVVLTATDGCDLWLNTFTKVRKNDSGDVLPPTDKFLDIAFSAVNKMTAGEQIEGFVSALKAIGFTDAQLNKFKTGLFDVSAPAQKLKLRWRRLTTNGTVYYSVEKV